MAIHKDNLGFWTNIQIFVIEANTKKYREFCKRLSLNDLLQKPVERIVYTRKIIICKANTVPYVATAKTDHR